MSHHHHTYGDECPSCGRFYQLTTMAPPVPAMLLEVGSDEDIDAWVAEHDYNVTTCQICGWSDGE